MRRITNLVRDQIGKPRQGSHHRDGPGHRSEHARHRFRDLRHRESLMPASARIDRNRAGFSILELLIAMTLAVAVVGVGFSLFHSQSTLLRHQPAAVRPAPERARRARRRAARDPDHGRRRAEWSADTGVRRQSGAGVQQRLHRGRHRRYPLGGLFQCRNAVERNDRVGRVQRRIDSRHRLHLSDGQLPPRQRRSVAGRDVHLLLLAGLVDGAHRRLHPLAARQQRDADHRRPEHPGPSERQSVLPVPAAADAQHQRHAAHRAAGQPAARATDPRSPASRRPTAPTTSDPTRCARYGSTCASPTDRPAPTSDSATYRRWCRCRTTASRCRTSAAGRRWRRRPSRSSTRFREADASGLPGTARSTRTPASTTSCSTSSIASSRVRPPGPTR